MKRVAGFLAVALVAALALSLPAASGAPYPGPYPGECSLEVVTTHYAEWWDFIGWNTVATGRASCVNHCSDPDMQNSDGTCVIQSKTLKQIYKGQKFFIEVTLHSVDGVSHPPYTLYFGQGSEEWSTGTKTITKYEVPQLFSATAAYDMHPERCGDECKGQIPPPLRYDCLANWLAFNAYPPVSTWPERTTECKIRLVLEKPDGDACDTPVANQEGNEGVTDSYPTIPEMGGSR